jgi:hypothetical protein
MSISEKMNKVMDNEKMNVGEGSGRAIPDQPERDLNYLQMRMNAVLQNANELRLRVRKIADNVYGDEVEAEDPMHKPDSRIDMVGSINCLGSEIGQLEQMLAGVHEQVSRLQNL